MDIPASETSEATILYTEDDRTTRDMVTIIINRNFPRVNLLLADNGQQGLELFSSRHPDIILTDIIMPVMDGIQMARKIKAIDKNARVIILSAASDTQHILDAIDIGVNGYVLKPINMERLIASVEHCLNGIRMERQLRQQGEYIRQMAYHDSLTDLPNRLLLNELLHQALAQARRNNQDRQLAVLFIDLDRFKLINDTLGHNVGDQLLQAVAHRLKECCRRDQDTVARLGGDEFIILLPELETAQEAVRIAQKILDSFAGSFMLPEHEVFVSTSIGIAIFPVDGDDSNTLIKHADMAMYRAKERGRNRYQLYNPAMDARASQRLAMETSLRQAIERQELILNYQPKVNVKSGRVVSFEALVRWQHPELGLIPPKQFIPLAEEIGLIIPISEWILRTACAQNRAWQDAHHPPVRVAVNFTPRQFQTFSFAEMVENVLAETSLDPSWLELEVTEGIMLQNFDNTITTLRRLSDLGIHISIDNFGTGYSSLSSIKKLPIDTLKIDQSFVNDITVNAEDEAIATAVVTLAHSLNLNVVAEGVEIEEQARLLDSLDCSEMQGFFFSKPLPADEIVPLLDKQYWRGAPSRDVTTH